MLAQCRLKLAPVNPKRVAVNHDIVIVDILEEIHVNSYLIFRKQVITDAVCYPKAV